ncbi:hypothetical protein PZA11_003721 [Diplocarpon coronariae]
MPVSVWSSFGHELHSQVGGIVAYSCRAIRPFVALVVLSLMYRRGEYQSLFAQASRSISYLNHTNNSLGGSLSSGSSDCEGVIAWRIPVEGFRRPPTPTVTSLRGLLSRR